MCSSSKEKYLGDVITCSAKIDENVKLRHDKGMGIVNDVMSILKEISFGYYHFEMGSLFRNSKLLNGILFNTEVLFSITEKHILQLEECDKYLMRSLFNAGMGTPIESFFIETSSIPIRFILKGKRIMFYWELLRKGGHELVKRVFKATKEFKDKTDWVSQVEEDLSSCDINLTEDEIAKMSRWKFKKIVQRKIKEQTETYLTELQMKHTKSSLLQQGPTMQEYLKSEKLSTKQKQLLFKLRSSVTPNKANFRQMYENDLSCILCKDPNTVENLQHLRECPYLVGQPKLADQLKSIKCEDIFGQLSEQIKAVQVWGKVFKIYTKQKEQPN